MNDLKAMNDRLPIFDRARMIGLRGPFQARAIGDDYYYLSQRTSYEQYLYEPTPRIVIILSHPASSALSLLFNLCE